MALPSIRLLSKRLTRIALISFAPGVVLAADLLAIDIFTTSSRPVANPFPAAHSRVELNVVEIDAIERFNAELSERLPDDPTIAQAQVHKRLATLSPDEIATLRHAAIGLATAAQLGVDRTPAIVFDKQAVIYGLTDLTEAINRYRAWTRKFP